jgi:hypothetical protein
MKASSNEGISQPLVNKLKSQLTVRQGRGGQVVVQKRRRPRGNRGTPNQASWVDDFKNAAAAWKLIGGCTKDQADAFADSPPAGLTFWRDHLSTAAAGKHFEDMGDFELLPQTPAFWNGATQGPFRVTTPTVSVYRTVAENLTNSVDKTLTPDNADWDNNAFWSPIDNPTRLTARAAGLYLIHATVRFNNVIASQRIVRFKVNGTNLRMNVRFGQYAAVASDIGYSTLWPFLAGDYVEVTCNSNSNGTTALLMQFQMVGITPESII